jgi:glycosyltransferase involved in cell wall biosynthesis
MAAPAVSVVVPTHNRRELLVQTLASIHAQTVTVEVIVVDDASSDGTADMLAGEDVTVVRHDTAVGGAASRNDGATRATTEWLAFCDDDDLWAPDKLAAQLTALADHPSARWGATGCVWIDEARHVIGGRWMPDHHDDIAALLKIRNHVPGGGSSAIVSAELFAAVGGFTTDLEGCDDWEMWLRLAEHSPVAYVDRPLVAYREWSGNRFRDLERAERAHAEVRRRHGIPPDSSGERDQTWRMHLGRRRAENGDRWGSARAYLAAGIVGRAPGQLAYAAAAVTSPESVVRRLHALDCERLPSGWYEESRRWLGAR